MDRFKSCIEVDAPASQCYQQWHDFENFPRFMKNVKSVTRQDDQCWHWVVNGPLGKDIEWDAVMDGDEPSKVISWHTVSEPDVGVQGAVRFDEIDEGRTQVTCTIQYKPPAGPLGELIAGIFSNPHKMVEEDLENFKHLVEGTNQPARSMRGNYGNSFDTPSNAAGSNTMSGSVGTASMASGVLGVGGTGIGSIEAANSYQGASGVDTPADQELGVGSLSPGMGDRASGRFVEPSIGGNAPEVGFEPGIQEGISASIGHEPAPYDGPFGLDDDMIDDEVNAVADAELNEDVIPGTRQEEAPYLGQAGIAGEQDIDLIDMRADEDVIITEESDVFTESMDVYDEDLESFTEDLDDGIDSALTPRGLNEDIEMSDDGELVNQNRPTESGQS